MNTSVDLHFILTKVSERLRRTKQIKLNRNETKSLLYMFQNYYYPLLQLITCIKVYTQFNLTIILYYVQL